MTAHGLHRLLIVEDDHEIRYLLSVVLAAEDREVVAVPTGAEAREVLEKGGIDLVVLDLILPDVDGRTLLTDMRGRPETAEVPVVVVTARTGPETRQESYALGADAFVEKPFDPDEFAQDIGLRLERAAQAERRALSDSLTGLLNRAGMKELCEKAESGYGLGLVEIDGFGVRSEHWGWDRTEQVVRDVAHALRDGVPDRVELGRIGGGDLALLVTGEGAPAIADVATEALQIVKGLTLEGPEGDSISLTATIGVLAVEGGTALDDALDLARQRIFQAREVEGDHVVTAESVSASGRGHVLVAEDDEISATILIHRLEKEGLDIVRFDNGQDAYDAAMAEKPDLVILDVKMPGLDGFEVLSRLRRDPRFSGTPIIMLTSMGQEADVVRGFRLGADDYILKPFSPTELSARVRRLLRRGRSTAAT